jgi:hypothetical protein
MLTVLYGRDGKPDSHRPPFRRTTHEHHPRRLGGVTGDSTGVS